MTIPILLPSYRLFKLSNSSRIVTAAAKHSSSEVPQRSDEWFNLRKEKLITSSFSTAMGFWDSSRRSELWRDKVFSTNSSLFTPFAEAAMNWGSTHETTAIANYEAITGRTVRSFGFAVHRAHELNWLGGSPDGVLDPNRGILEVKCPYNKGKPELGLPWETVPYYYIPQVQGLMEIMDRNWAELYCWTPNGSTLFRVERDREYFLEMYKILNEFWQEYVLPAKKVVKNGGGGGDGLEVDLNDFMPRSNHPLTPSLVAMSKKLASEARLLCRDIGGVVMFYNRRYRSDNSSILK